jgi:hypothetical protein
MKPREAELSKLASYKFNDPLAQLRTFREEVKRAAKDGKDTILIPSGETAMKIEGLGEGDIWTLPRDAQTRIGGLEDIARRTLNNERLKVGLEVKRFGENDRWIITDVLENGRFKAVPKTAADEAEKNGVSLVSMSNEFKESFDISGKANTSHFVYKLNEEAIPKEARKQGLIVEGRVEQDNGEWWKIKIPKERADMPVEAFGAAPFMMMNREEKDKQQPFGLPARLEMSTK